MNRRTETIALSLLTLALAACGGGGAGPSTGSPSALADNSLSRALSGPPALPVAQTGLSGNVTCRNISIGAEALDSVFVPADSACVLEGTRLIGSITVARGATLEARAVRVNGNVQADGAAHVSISELSTVGGAVQVKQGGHVRVEGARLTGDLQIDDMRGPVFALGNTVGGNIQVVGNRGGATVGGNRVNGNLLCKENVPAPRAFDNTAALLEEQCAAGAATGGGGGGGSGGGSGGSGGAGAGGTVPVTTTLAGNVTCDGLRIGAQRLDSLFVPDGATCVLEGTRLIGSIQVGAGSTLTATDVTVAGNVQAEGAASTELLGDSRIGGSVQLKQGGSATVMGARIVGDLQFDAMAGPLSAGANVVGGNLQVFENRSDIVVVANVIEGALQCNGNLRPPTGGGNQASIREDQCRPL